MHIIGLTGSIACGKSTVSMRLRALGALVIDADALSRALTQDGGRALPAIRARFGDEVFQGSSLNRRALGAIVFTNARAKAELEAILHPLILADLRAALQAARKSGANIVVLDVPLLFESGMDALCDEIFCVWVDEETQLARLMARDRLTEAEARARIASQMPQADKLARSDVHIDNNGTPAQTCARVDALYAAVLAASEAHA